MKKLKVILSILSIMLISICFSTEIIATNSDNEIINTVNQLTEEPIINSTESNNDTSNNEITNKQTVQTSSQSEVKPQVTNSNEQVKKSNDNIEEEQDKSTNNYLKSITVNKEGLTPEFNKNTRDYYIIVPLDMNNLKVTAEPEDSNAKVSVTGNTDLKKGENIITITVTSEKGNWRTYKINATKTDDTKLANANLKMLEIKGYTIQFSPSKYKYAIEIDEKQSNLDISAIPENEKANVIIEKNEELKSGENKIIIRVISEDGNTQKNYIIYAIKDFEKIQVEKMSSTTKVIIICVCLVLFLGCMILLIYRITKRERGGQWKN